MVAQSAYGTATSEAPAQEPATITKELRLGGSTITGVRFLLEGIKNTPNPSVSLYVETGNSATLLDKLRRGAIEAAIVGTMPHEDEAFQFWEIGKEEEVLAVPRGHRLCGKKVVSLEEVGRIMTDPEEVFIQTRKGGTQVAHERLLNELDVSVCGRFVITSVEGVKQAVLAGLGISILPRAAVASEIEANRITGIRIGDEGRFRTFYLAVNKGIPLSEYAAEFIRKSFGLIPERVN